MFCLHRACRLSHNGLPRGVEQGTITMGRIPHRHKLDK
jgi:hypothetical protein